MEPPENVTGLLRAWEQGDAGALEKLTPLVYTELRRLAARSMRRERPGATLQTTALAHEAYLRLVDVRDARWQDRAHFFAVASQIIRRILVDSARTRGAIKRGGGMQRVDHATAIDLDAIPNPESEGRELLALDGALTELARMDPRKGRVVELRFFGGLSVEETAEVLKVSPQAHFTIAST